MAADDAGETLGWSPERLHRVEKGQAVIRMVEARNLLRLYGVADQPLLDLVSRTDHWWAKYSDLVGESFESLLVLEDGATWLRTHQPSLVPGLLQTDRYAWELMTTLSDQPLEAIAQRVEVRAARRAVLTREHQPLHLAAVIDEAALRRPVGDTSVMREQIEWLIEAAGRPNVEIRVRTLDTGPDLAMGSSFHIFGFANGDPPVAQQELLDREQFTDQSDDVQRYLRAFEHATVRSLNPEQSLAFMTTLVRA
nr:DUF5753 domain-containing protein [Acrocarpospora catenulata]